MVAMEHCALPTTVDRAIACLKGVATGDAIGKQTEMLPHDEVRRWYPEGVRGFEGVPGEIIPRYVGNRKHQWRIAETTDDTERTLAVARAILANGTVSHVSIGREMLGCTKCVHPGVASLWEFHQAADPARVATAHDGCGAAVRVAPVGIIHPSEALDDLVSAAREASISTHGGSLGIAGAAAVAGAVSAAVDGATPSLILERAEHAASMAESRERRAPALGRAIRSVHEVLADLPQLSAAEIAARCFPDHPLTIVPLALGLATLLTSAEQGILLAANIGGDSDSVASIAGGILGAMYPSTVNEDWHQIVDRINRLDLVPLGEALARRRSRARAIGRRY
jgi:ADP-ribosylglycohydrolase